MFKLSKSDIQNKNLKNKCFLFNLNKILNSIKMLSKIKIEEISYENKTKSGFNFNLFERFDDDLCQLLLSFLSISDKIKFECVSKQWKYLIFNKQQKLIINGTKTIDTMPISYKFMEKMQIL